MAVYKVTPFVHIQQPTSETCWFTCLRMVIGYHLMMGNRRRGRLQMPEAVPGLLSDALANQPQPWSRYVLDARACGLTPLYLSPDADALLDILQQYGPVVYNGAWTPGRGGHVVVVTGINTTTGLLSVSNPLRSTPQSNVPMNALWQRLRPNEELPLVVYA